MALETKQLHALSQIYKEAVYGGAKKEAPKDTRLVVTAADKKANTKAYQNYKSGHKGYKAADHLKDDKDWGYDKKGNSLNPVDKMKKQRRKDELFGSPKTKKESFSNWREDLKEVPNYEQIPIDAKKRNEKITEKNVKNTIKINPEMKEDVEIISEKEVDVKDTRRTVDAIRAYDKSKDASKDATYDSDHGKKGKAKKEKEYAAKERGEIDKDDPNWKKKKYHTGMHGESYEKQKTKEVLSALKRDKRPLDKKTKAKIAADIVKKKGDTSKSDDRYAYESKLWDQVAANLTELGDLNDADFKVEGYQRNPEKGEEESRKAKRERKGGYDEKREKRMSSPTRGIDSPAFKEFMRSRGM